MAPGVIENLKSISSNGAAITDDFPKRLDEIQALVGILVGSILLIATINVGVLIWAVSHESK